ncbi:nuclear transport factor 2 family protein [Flavobacterium sp. CAU 1735]|uniref:nuclear transport factor 2 family protein n=1 Tax=Flavobacterium sp. CAU 1735 TaxID=3140361 RepID=UPI00325FF559
MMKKTGFLLLLFCLTTTLFGQEQHHSELYRTLQEKDSLLFNVGFNTCDIRQFENLISDHFEFYHDLGGITKSKAEFISGIQNGLCQSEYKSRRALIRESLQVYPLKQNGVLYGAIQTGKHRFYETGKNKQEYPTSIAQFTHVWLLENGVWKFSRGLSYDHQPYKP